MNYEIDQYNSTEHIKYLHTVPQCCIFLIALRFINFPPYIDKISFFEETEDRILHGQICFDLIYINYRVIICYIS